MEGPPDSRKTRTPNRPDLGDEEFRGLDLEKLNRYRTVLDSKRLFGYNVEDQPITPDMVEESKDPFARGNMSYVFSAKVKGQWFASKRSWITIEDDRKSYEKEIKSLKALQESANRHIILLISHYTKLGLEGRLLLSPLAECTLGDYISQTPTLGRKVVVMRWFGCLAGAVRDIHQKNIKHKDIKAKNILVHGDNIVITDLGISNKFTERSTSLGNSPGSLTYMAPEVINSDRRGRQQDVWSLICCFIEMFSFISGFATSDFRKWCNPSGYLFNFNNDHDKVTEWLNYLGTQSKEEAHRMLVDLLLDGFKKDPMDRPTAGDIFDRLRDVGTFVGECCAVPRRHQGSKMSEASLSFPIDPQRLIPKTLPHFIVGTARRVMSRLDIPSVHTSMSELLEDVELGRVRSFRSAERNLIFFIAPRNCSSAEEYLSFCNAFIGELSQAVTCEGYRTCLYNEQAGEEEKPYTTAYFAILVEEILSRCRTYPWGQ